MPAIAFRTLALSCAFTLAGCATEDVMRYDGVTTSAGDAIAEPTRERSEQGSRSAPGPNDTDKMVPSAYVSESAASDTVWASAAARRTCSSSITRTASWRRP